MNALQKMLRTMCLLLTCVTLIGCAPSVEPGPERITIGMMPKLIGISYFNACQKGAEEAAAELDVELVYDGPDVDRVEDQARIVDGWSAQGFRCIAVAPNDPEVISPPLRRAKEAGAVTLTWDADANPTASGRALFVNQAPVDAVAHALVDVLAEQIGGEGTAVIVTGSATSPNQTAWMASMRKHLAAKYPKINVPEALVSDEDQAKAQQLTRDAMSAHPNLKGVWGITSVALPGAAKAVRDAGMSGKVAVTGLSLPNTVREYVKDGTIAKFVLWNPVDLGYLTVYVAKRLADGALPPGTHDFGRLKGIVVTDGEALLGEPVIFDANTIDQFDF